MMRSHPRFVARRAPRVHIRLALAWVACALVLLLGACDNGDPILVGFVGQLEGTFSDLGVQGRNGATLALEDANAEGGVRGRPLRLIAADDANTPEGARTAVRNLHARGAAILLGHMTSAQSMAGHPEAEKLGMVMISPTASSPLLSGKDDLFFRVIPESTQGMRALAEHCAVGDGVKTIVQITDMRNAAFTVPTNQVFAETFIDLGGRILDRVLIPAGSTPSWDALSTHVAELAPDAIQAALASRDLAALVRRLRIKAPQVRVYSSMWGYTDELIEAGGSAVDSIIFSATYVGDNKTPSFIRFQQHFRERFGRAPNFAATLGYEAASVAVRALREGGDDPRAQARVIAGLRDFQGIIGPLKFDDYGDVTRPALIVTIRNGSFTSLTTLENEP